MREWLKTGDVYHALCFLINRQKYPAFLQSSITVSGFFRTDNINVWEQTPFYFVPDDVSIMVSESWVIQPPRMVVKKARDPHDLYPHVLTNWILVC